MLLEIPRSLGHNAASLWPQTHWLQTLPLKPPNNDHIERTNMKTTVLWMVGVAYANSCTSPHDKSGPKSAIIICGYMYAACRVPGRRGEDQFKEDPHLSPCNTRGTFFRTLEPNSMSSVFIECHVEKHSMTPIILELAVQYSSECMAEA